MGKKEHSIRMNRREAVCLLGIGAGFGLASLWGKESGISTALQLTTQSAKKLTFPEGAIVRTVLKDLSPDALANGVTLFHEHLSYDFSALPGTSPVPRPADAPPPRPNPTLNLDLIVEEVKAAGKAGIGCIVDGGHPDMKRKLENLRTLAMTTGVYIVGSAGYWMQRSYPPDIATKSEDQIADELVQEAQRDHLGALGEIGQNNNESELLPDELKVFRAVGKAHVRTNLPVFTHNPYGTGPNVRPDNGLRQLDALESVGVDPKHVVIGHACCLDDPTLGIFKQIAKRGAFVGFDRVASMRPVSDDIRLPMAVAFIEAGYADNLLISSDYTGQQTLEEGPGYSRALTIFAPKLISAGVKEDVLHQIMYDNPRRFISFVPKKA